MSQIINLKLPFISPTGMSGEVRLLHDGRAGETALLSIDMKPMPACSGHASLTTAAMHRLVDALMDAIQINERQERLLGAEAGSLSSHQ